MSNNESNWKTFTAIGSLGCGVFVLFIAIFALSAAFYFGVGYGIGILVEMIAGKSIILGPLSLPLWLAIMSTILGLFFTRVNVEQD